MKTTSSYVAYAYCRQFSLSKLCWQCECVMFLSLEKDKNKIEESLQKMTCLSCFQNFKFFFYPINPDCRVSGI